MTRLSEIVANGNRGRGSNWIICVDGFKLSVIAGLHVYCTPRPGGFEHDDVPDDYPGPYTHVEVGFPSERPEPWACHHRADGQEWCDRTEEPLTEPHGWECYAEDGEKPTETVYAYVPVLFVEQLIKLHGGES